MLAWTRVHLKLTLIFYKVYYVSITLIAMIAHMKVGMLQ